MSEARCPFCHAAHQWNEITQPEPWQPALQRHENAVRAELLELIKTVKNPYPETIFPMTVKGYCEAIPDKTLRTAISGCLGRWAFDMAADMILRRVMEDLEEEES